MKRPLEGVRVLDLTRVLSGPFATQQLVDLGADVIKVEHPKGDVTRRFGPPFVHGTSSYFLSINRGKKSVAIDLKHPRGPVLVVGLAQHADVYVENFRPGVADRLGVGPDKLRELHPRLITCSISGWGTGGVAAYDEAPAYDAVIQSATGLMHLTGDPDGHATKTGVAISDLSAGLFAAQGISAALFERERTGVGRHIEVSMQDAAASLLTYQAGIYFATGSSPKRTGNTHPSICPYETVQTKDGLFTLAVGTDDQFSRLCDVLSLPWVKTDDRFSTNATRVVHREALMALLAPKMLMKTRSEWTALFAAQNISGGPVLDVAEALGHPQLKARHSILHHHHAVMGKTRSVATPIRLDGAAPAKTEAPHLLGEDTRHILRTDLGLTDAEIDELVGDGAVVEAPPSE